ncbi:ComF family protein [Defluviitalea phaphyphila]|uniref:ComF family protein n=1 Tax=Defluviitalea phaphyphila TaxID=1473580 RepID=UPI00073066F6|nr:ComF family protein [Defluviitalea phaphyphila]
MLIDIILNIIYPPKCIFCNTIIPIQKEKGICDDCKKSLPFIKEKVCQKCGKPIDNIEERNTCFDCIKYPPIYDKGWALLVYEGIVRDMIYRFKYGGHKEYAVYLGVLMANKIKNENIKEKFDLIIPIPMHLKKKRIRGYNQSEELAKIISKQLKIPIDITILTRIKETKPQSGLSITQRKNNLKKAFKIKQNTDLKGKKILLIDDIYTTGSTINTCANILKKKGVKKVCFLSLSIGRDK